MMIFSINHIDLKNRKESNTKLFSRYHRKSTFRDSNTDDLVDLSGLGKIMSRSGLDDKHFRFETAGSSMEFSMVFMFNSVEKLTCDGSYDEQTGVFEFLCDALHVQKSESSVPMELRTHFEMIADNLRKKVISPNTVEPDIQSHFSHLFKYLQILTKSELPVRIENPATLSENTDNRDVLQEALIRLVENLFAIGQFKRLIEEQKQYFKEQAPSKSLHTITSDDVLFNLRRFVWKTTESRDRQVI